MKTTLCFTLTLIAFVTLAFVSNSSAQNEINNAPAYVVRLAYVLPKDREAQPDIDAKFDTLIKATQSFFANEMERHGYGRKTFRFEADASGNAIVHHIKSSQNDEYFQNWTGDPQAMRNYFGEHFNLDKYIFLEANDVSKERLGYGRFCGHWGGVASIPASGECFDVSVVAHELGHGFGLTHNFYDNSYIMSYGAGSDRLSACAAEWLDVSPYFNPDKVVIHNRNTRAELLSSSFDAAPPHALRLRLEISDPDGLHQVQLITTDENINFSQYVDCRELQGVRDIVEFELITYAKGVGLHVIDKSGNFMRTGFDISDTVIPSSVVVEIPDANLASAIRDALGTTLDAPITSFALSRLQTLSAIRLGITDLTGLEHAVSLRRLSLGFNRISDITPLKNMTRLVALILQYNQLSDIAPLKKLVQLETLYLDNNNLIDDITPLSDMQRMRYLQLPSPLLTDISPLSRMTRLVELYIGKNQISDITPLSKMTQLESLTLFNNQITDIHPLSRMTRLVRLYLEKNQISDITPLSKMTQLESLNLSNNQIIDIHPLSELTNLKELNLHNNEISDVRPLLKLSNLNRIWIWGNPIIDREPLLTLLRRNPGIKIYHKKGGEPLPVTLSRFKAVQTGVGAVLKWTTESELDNAGFYIYRSKTRDGEFKVVNATMIQGAGTTGERNEYTWTDITAKLNTVYYYRIEDVSHAGVRGQLATVRLRGFVSASGKLTTRWAALKAEN